MHLIKNHQFIFMAGEVGFRIGELGAVCGALKIEINGGARIANFLRERGLAGLARPEQGNGRGSINRFDEFLLYMTFNHPCNYGIQYHIYKKSWPF
jgi:hypothetical protein